MIKSFEDLDCWKKATALRKRIGLLVKNFPSEEKFRLIDQLIRSSRSVTANIAEGYGRFHFQENIQFCRQGRGSLYEIIDHLIVAFDEGYLSEKDLSDLKSDINECLAVLNGYINYLTRAKSEANKVGEPLLSYTTPDNE
ncbi:MAG: four helix bundle protein [Cyclobacteriaceae bacterium]|nr:four helix bundle protein [Cyclobacteriaceae bacterium]